MATATKAPPKRAKKYRFQVLASKHYEDQTDENGRVTTREFSAHDPTCNVVETDIDLAERYNQPGFSEKFRLLPALGQTARTIPDDVFIQEAIRRGLLKPEDVANVLEAPAEVAEESEEGAHATPDAPPHPALANLSRIPEVGLRKLAEDEEIDVAHCTTEVEVREAVRLALVARSLGGGR